VQSRRLAKVRTFAKKDEVICFGARLPPVSIKRWVAERAWTVLDPFTCLLINLTVASPQRDEHVSAEAGLIYVR
jgi:hypothetical protein